MNKILLLIIIPAFFCHSRENGNPVLMTERETNMKNFMQNKKTLLFTLILMASCLGILGVGEIGEAKLSGSDFFCKGDVCAIGDDWCGGNTSDDSVNLLINYKYEDGEYKNRECGDRIFTNLCYTTKNNKFSITGKQVNFSCYESEDKCIVFIMKENSESCLDDCCKLKGSAYSCKDGECTVEATICGSRNCEYSNPSTCKCGNSFTVFNFMMPQFNRLYCCAGNNRAYATSEECKVGACAPPTTPTTPQLPTTPTTPTAPQLPTTPQLSTNSGGITIQEPTSTSSGSTINLSDKPLSKILEDLIKWLLQIVILIAILMIIVSGAMYMISAGDQTKTDTAKKALTYAILGLLVVGLAYAIVDTLVDILAG